jgi:hypothetical protein
VQANEVHAIIKVGSDFGNSGFAHGLIHPTLKIEYGLILIEAKGLVLADTVE